MHDDNPFRRPRLPFSLGTTSYVYRDTYAANIRRLAPCFDEIELLLFEGQRDQWPSDREMQSMSQIADRHHLKYNVHLPLDIQLGHSDPSIATHGREVVGQVMSHTEALQPTTHTLHLSPHPAGAQPTDEEIRAWQDGLCRHFEAMAKEGLDLQKISIENIMYPFAWVAPVVRQFKLGICFDIAHLWLQAGSVSDFLETYGDQIVLCHVCGCMPDGLHTSLRRIPFETLQPFLEFGRDFPHAVILEVFDPQDLQDSMDYLADCMGRLAD